MMWLAPSSQLFRIAGVDLTQIDGIQLQTAQTVISEVGVDMSRWRTEKQFASWLGLCQDNRISGGKILPWCTVSTRRYPGPHADGRTFSMVCKIDHPVTCY